MKLFGFLSLLLLTLFWSIGNAVYASPVPSIPLNAHSSNEIKLKKSLNKEGVFFTFQHQGFETALQLPVFDKINTQFWLSSKRIAPVLCSLKGSEIQYIIYSNTIEPGLDTLIMIFPFHTYI